MQSPGEQLSFINFQDGEEFKKCCSCVLTLRGKNFFFLFK